MIPWSWKWFLGWEPVYQTATVAPSGNLLLWQGTASDSLTYDGTNSLVWG